MHNKYYIITRFNAEVFPTRPDLASRRLDTEWLKERVRLFKKYCFPSVINQCFTDFEWIVWCHPDSPEWMRDELSALVSECEYEGLNHFMTVLYTDSYEDYIDTNVDILVTTRLDNDDMIHQNFMLDIFNNTHYFIEFGLPRQIYSFTNGYRYHEKSGIITRAHQKNSPFLTMFANLKKQSISEEPYHVYCTNHGTIVNDYPIVFNHDYRAWIWVEHDNNTASIAAIREEADSTLLVFPDFGVLK